MGRMKTHPGAMTGEILQGQLSTKELSLHRESLWTRQPGEEPWGKSGEMIRGWTFGGWHCQSGSGIHEMEQRGDTGAGLSSDPMTPLSPNPHALDLSFPSPAPLASAQDANRFTEPICLRLAHTFLFCD